ncbi:hypothetical protein [Piscinibacter sp. XHJ-5]|uniref:hypothetical protein n=1 Tax=Piscinibacter sp. XHJ-5 TaxID=3037797 RepID=UPI002452BEE5|nr:hypothetical protein [Piscinibacter sp. XHJ-5]
MIRLDGQVMRGFDNGHAGRLGEQIGQPAVVPAVEVLHQHECHAGVFRQRLKQLHERFQSASGCADADHGEADMEFVVCLRHGGSFLSGIGVGRAVSPGGVGGLRKLYRARCLKVCHSISLPSPGFTRGRRPR